MLCFYGTVPALKATTGASPATTQTQAPPTPVFLFFLSVNLSLWKSVDPSSPHSY